MLSGRSLGSCGDNHRGRNLPETAPGSLGDDEDGGVVVVKGGYGGRRMSGGEVVGLVLLEDTESGEKIICTDGPLRGNTMVHLMHHAMLLT